MARWIVLAVALATVAAPATWQGGNRADLDVSAGARLVYGGPEFAGLVAESYRYAGDDGLVPFTRWLEEAYASKTGGQLARAIHDARARVQAAPTAGERAARELDAARWLHGVVKAVLPHFNVDRGHEFANAVRYGERQCFLQSVLLASLLQAVGVPAGVFMVWQNPEGQKSNNGHATAFAVLSTGHSVLVDASYREPFVPHRGVFARAGGRYRFLEPVHGDGRRIEAYRSGGRRWETRAVVGLDLEFLRSQFHYYRGERAPGGPLSSRPTAEGLAEAARFLREAQRVAPGNALAVYMLGNVYRRQGSLAEAREQYRRAYHLYAAYGHVPTGPAQAYAWAAAR
jgi:tetratricopeptide (TPR) repeat protein